MPDAPAGMRVGRFGPFEVNLTTGELRKHGIRLKIQDQPFQILALLLASQGKLVTREEIRQRLWPSGTFVDFDNGLNTALSRLREALGDFSSGHGGELPPTSVRLMRFPLTGGSPEQVLETPSDPMTDFKCPSRPSSSCVVSHWEQGQLIFYALDPIKGQGKEVIRTKLERTTDLNWSISPDGSLTAIASTDQLRGQVRTLNLQSGAERKLQLPQGWSAYGLNWAADSTAVVAHIQAVESLIVRIEMDGKIRTLIERQRERLLGPCPSPDGRHLAYSQGTIDTNVWLLENF